MGGGESKEVGRGSREKRGKEGEKKREKGVQVYIYIPNIQKASMKLTLIPFDPVFDNSNNEVSSISYTMIR